MAAAASTFFCNSKFMSKGCWISVTSLLRSILCLSSVASSSNSLPPNHTATRRPFRSAALLMPDDLNASSRMPLYANTCAMFTSGAPWSRAERRLGSQSMPNWAPPPATTCSGTMSGPPGRMVTSSFSAS